MQRKDQFSFSIWIHLINSHHIIFQTSGTYFNFTLLPTLQDLEGSKLNTFNKSEIK
jgi:hypothetical protein